MVVLRVPPNRPRIIEPPNARSHPLGGGGDIDMNPEFMQNWGP